MKHLLFFLDVNKKIVFSSASPRNYRYDKINWLFYDFLNLVTMDSAVSCMVFAKPSFRLTGF